MTTLLLEPETNNTEQGMIGNVSMALHIITGNKISLNLEGPPWLIKQVNKKD